MIAQEVHRGDFGEGEHIVGVHILALFRLAGRSEIRLGVSGIQVLPRSGMPVHAVSTGILTIHELAEHAGAGGDTVTAPFEVEHRVLVAAVILHGSLLAGVGEGCIDILDDILQVRGRVAGTVQKAHGVAGLQTVGELDPEAAVAVVDEVILANGVAAGLDVLDSGIEQFENSLVDALLGVNLGIRIGIRVAHLGVRSVTEEVGSDSDVVSEQNFAQTARESVRRVGIVLALRHDDLRVADVLVDSAPAVVEGGTDADFGVTVLRLEQLVVGTGPILDVGAEISVEVTTDDILRGTEFHIRKDELRRHVRGDAGIPVDFVHVILGAGRESERRNGEDQTGLAELICFFHMLALLKS